MGDILQGCILVVLMLRTDLRVRSLLSLAMVSEMVRVDPGNGGIQGNRHNLVCVNCHTFFSDAALLLVLLGWNLASPSFRVRAFQTGTKQGLLTRGGVLNSISLFLSLLPFVCVSVMFGYQSIFLAPLPLVVTSAMIFVAKSLSDRQFRTWMLGPKVTHCLLASIFPVTTPRPKQEVHSKI